MVKNKNSKLLGHLSIFHDAFCSAIECNFLNGDAKAFAKMLIHDFMLPQEISVSNFYNSIMVSLDEDCFKYGFLIERENLTSGNRSNASPILPCSYGNSTPKMKLRSQSLQSISESSTFSFADRQLRYNTRFCCSLHQIRACFVKWFARFTRIGSFKP